MKLRNGIRSKNHQETRAKAIGNVFKEFCSNSTIHGVRYFTARKHHWSERIFWILAFGLSVCICGISIHTIWVKWRESPITMSFTEKELPISAIPFPTITICPEAKAIKRKFDVTAVCDSLLSPKMTNLTDKKWAILDALSHLCQFNFPDFVQYGHQFTNTSIYDTIIDVAPPFGVIASCMWNYQAHFCTDYFTPVLTEEGLCFAFNALNSNEIYTDEMAPEMMIVTNNPNVSHWSLENGYDDTFVERGYPIRVFNVKASAALTIFLQLNGTDVEYRCRGLVPGFKLLLHTPGEVPGASQYNYRVPLSEEALISIKPTMITTSENLRSYDPQQRQCFFDTERRLRFFKIYSQSNCEAECLANFTRKQCGCVKFSMPRKSTTKICGTKNVRCYQSAERRLFGEYISNGRRNDAANDFLGNCNCLPACTSIQYEADVDRAKLNWIEAKMSHRFHFGSLFTAQPSNVEIFFRDHQVTMVKRSEVYTWTDFMAVCGGLLGLFLGISTLSIIEFIYYSTLRLYWSLRRWKNSNLVVPFPQKTINSISIDISHD